MYEMMAAYVVGTAAGMFLFRQWVKEKVIEATFDSLIDQGYLHGRTDEEGMVQLTKWYDIPEQEKENEWLDNMTAEEVSTALKALIEEERRRNNDDDPS